MAVVTVRGLIKRYGELEAVRGIDFAVEAGEVFAVLGPNGAGKTTTMEILEGYRPRDAGDVDVLGFDPADGDRVFKERIGIVLQETTVEPELTVREALTFYGDLFPRRRPAEELVEVVGLEAKLDARVRTLSGGQQRRLQVALGLVGDPELLFLDEPTTGFDPSARRHAWKMIENLKALGKTVLLTTHYMDEAQNLADRVVVMARGRIVATGAPDEIGGRDDGAAVIRFGAEVPLGDLPLPVRTVGNVVEVRSADPVADLHRLTGWALERGIDLPGLTVTRPSLEDVYLRLTGGDGV